MHPGDGEEARTAMTCRSCGHENPRDARFCGTCGAAREPEKRPAATRRPPVRLKVSDKNPWLAAVLNAVPSPFGLGYVYLGRWWRVVGSLFARVLAFVAGVALGILVLFTSYYLVVLAFAAFLAPQVVVLALMAWPVVALVRPRGAK